MNRITPALTYIKPFGQLASASLVQASIAALVSKTLGASPLCGALVATEYVLARRALLLKTIKNSPFLYEQEWYCRVGMGVLLALAAHPICGFKQFEPITLQIIPLPLFCHHRIFRRTSLWIQCYVPQAISRHCGGSCELARCVPILPIAYIIVLSHVGITLAVRMAKALGNRSFNVAPPEPVLTALFISLLGTTLVAQALKASRKELRPWLRYV